MAGKVRREELREVRREYAWVYPLILGSALLGIGIWIGSSLFADKDSYGMNLFTEFVGIGATVFIINQIYDRRDRLREQEQVARNRECEKKQQIADKKRELVLQVRSQNNDVALRSIEELRLRGWLNCEDGALKGKNLSEANLTDADLEAANLQRAFLSKTQLTGAHLFVTDLRNANLYRAILTNANLLSAYLQEADLESAELQDAILWQVQLQGADLSYAHLQRADLKGANLKCANLEGANLQEAVLTKANLQGATLDHADMCGVNLRRANLRETTLKDATLPDGETYTNDIDLERYTDPNHHDFPSTLATIDNVRLCLENARLEFCEF